jgi:hypothetical protein
MCACLNRRYNNKSTELCELLAFAAELLAFAAELLACLADLRKYPASPEEFFAGFVNVHFMLYGLFVLAGQVLWQAILELMIFP